MTRPKSGGESRRKCSGDGRLPTTSRVRTGVRSSTAELSAERGACDRAERARTERAARIGRLAATVTADEALAPAVAAVIVALTGAADSIAQQRSAFEVALAEDRKAGEHVAAELRSCAQQEATLQAELHRENEALTETEVRLQRTEDRAAETAQELQELAGRLELAAEPASAQRNANEIEALRGRLERLLRRREQLGPVNPLAQEEYARGARPRRGARASADGPGNGDAGAAKADQRH